MRIWSSLGSVTVAVPLMVIVISWLLVLEVFQHGVELREPLRPRVGVGRDPVVNGLEGRPVEPVEALAARVADVDHADLAEDTQVLGHLRLRDAERAHEVVDRPLAAGQHVEDRAAPRLRHRVERIRRGRRSCHATIIFLYQHMSIAAKIDSLKAIRVKVSNQVAIAAAAMIFAAPASAAVRVDQLGYAPGEQKLAYVIRHAPAKRFTVVDTRGYVVLRGRAGHSRGRWNKRYRIVQPLDLSALKATGHYRIRAGGSTSPVFRIAPAARLLGPRVGEAVAFFQAQRDGADVIAGTLHRRPAHLHDRALSVYRPPRYDEPDSDVILGRTLKAIGGPVDLEGGWMDAGDFIKFTHTTAYAATLLLVAERELGSAAPATLDPEVRFGLRWLDKAWDERSRTLMLQVGIGSGNAKGTFAGDHDVWRLPERDDALTGSRNRYLRRRPAFRANAPGEPIPPNL